MPVPRPNPRHGETRALGQVLDLPGVFDCHPRLSRVIGGKGSPSIHTSAGRVAAAPAWALRHPLDRKMLRRARPINRSSEEDRAQRLVGTVGADAESTHRRAGSHGCHVDREARELQQLERLALLPRQTVERLPDLGG